MGRKRTNATVRVAVRWFHRFRIKGQSELPPDESAEWARWSADDTNLDEFCRAKQLWQKLEVLSAMERPRQEEVADDGYDSTKSVRNWLARGSAKKPPLTPLQDGYEIGRAKKN